MALICRSVYSVLVVLLVGNVTAAEEGLFAQLQNLDRASPGQGWQSLQAAYDLGKLPNSMAKTSVFGQAAGTLTVVEPPPPDAQREALVKRYEAELAWEQKMKTLIMTTTVVLGGACVGSMVLRHVTVAVISCAATTGMYWFWKENQDDIEYLEDRLSKLKR